MDKVVEDTIFGCLPRAKKIEDGENGRCKIVLPCPVNQMEECEALRRALKESPARPTCLNCHSQNTRFRYFQNSSSCKSLQARYNCLACNQRFTFGGKKYPRHHNALTLMYPKHSNALALMYPTAQRDLVSDDHGVRGNKYPKRSNALALMYPTAQRNLVSDDHGVRGNKYPKLHNALTLMYPTAQKGLVSDDQGVRGKMYNKHQPNVLTIQQPNALTIQQPKM